MLTPSQHAILAAAGDIDLNVLLPFIRRQRKKLMKKYTDTSSKNRVECPECQREFANSQGLSTHLLARHRRALDDYSLDPWTRKLTLKSAIEHHDIGEAHDAMASLASAAAQRSADIQGGDGLWLVQQIQRVRDDDDEDDHIAAPTSSQPPTQASEPIESKESIDASNSTQVDDSLMSNHNLLQLSDSEGTGDDGNKSRTKIDRRKFNRGLKQRKSYS